MAFASGEPLLRTLFLVKSVVKDIKLPGMTETWQNLA